MSGSPRSLRRLGTAAGATLTLLATGAGPALASAPRAKVGSVTPRPAASVITGSTATSRRLRITLELQSRDPLGLKTFATAVSTPGSSQYGRFLSVRQFAGRFGARPSDAARVAATLRRDGLHVGALTPNNMQLAVSGTVGRLQRAFAVHEQQVRMPNGRLAYANAQAPTLPVAVAAYVQGVIGLDDISPGQPAGLARARDAAHPLSAAAGVTPRPQYPTNGGPQPCSSASAIAQGTSGASALTADQLATAYGFQNLYGQGDLGQGQTIALFEQQNFQLSDVQTYGACFGVAINPQVINVAGGPAANSGDAESELDIEVVAGMAPKANIQVYQGPSNQTVAIYNAMVAADQAKVISSSWGGCESITGAATIAAENTILQEAAAQGQSFFISSGDAGSAMCFQSSGGTQTQLSVIDPGGQPFATGVGGTNVFTQSNGSDNYYQPGDPVYQSVWNNGIEGNGRASASGGGLSSFFTMPSYQSSAPASLGVLNSGSSPAPCGGTTDCREVPDVSANADPNTGYAVYTGDNGPGSWAPVGGTSAAAPLWASFAALANGTASCRGLSLGFLNPSLYATAAAAYNSNFDDITLGSVFNPGTTGNDPFEGSGNDPDGAKFPVLTGYDMATGLGSMANAGTLAQSLCSARAPMYSVGVASPGNLTGTVGTAFAVQIHATDSGNAPLTYTASGLPAGLAINPANGIISGTPTLAGAATVTVSAADPYTNRGAAPAFTITIRPRAASHPTPSGRPTAGKVALTGLTTRRPTLAFEVRGGSGRLRTITVSLPKGMSFATARRRLARNITVRSGRRKVAFTAKVKRGRLTLTLARRESKVTVTITHPAIAITRREARAIKRRKVKSLSIVIGATNTRHKTGRHVIRVRRLR